MLQRVRHEGDAVGPDRRDGEPAVSGNHCCHPMEEEDGVNEGSQKTWAS